MNETITGRRVAPPDNAFETSARAMAEFVVRAAILPVTLLFSKPKDLAEGAASGDYKLLPSPYLLALITGVVVSGVTSNLNKFRVPTPAETQGGSDAPTDFVTAITEFYMKMDGVQAILFALPYIFALWALASLMSAFMLRGIDETPPLFASLSWCLTALVELTIVTVAVSLFIGLERSNVSTFLFIGFMVVTLLLAVKQIRLLLVLRRSANSHWAGAVVASVFALLVIFIAGAVGSGVSLAVFEQRVLVRQIYAAESDGRRTEALYRASEFIAARDYNSAIVEYDKAIEADPEFAGSYASRGDAYVQKGDYRAALKDYDEAIRLNPEDWALFTSRCRVQVLAKAPPAGALADCNRALELEPGAPAILGARAMAHLARGDFAAALADYEAVLVAQPDSVQALYGRGVALHSLGKVRDGERDMAAAVARAPAVAAPFAALGFDPLREGVPANAP